MGHGAGAAGVGFFEGHRIGVCGGRMRFVARGLRTASLLVVPLVVHTHVAPVCARLARLVLQHELRQSLDGERLWTCRAIRAAEEWA